MATLWLLNHVLFLFPLAKPSLSWRDFSRFVRKGTEKLIRNNMEFILSPLTYLIGSIAQKRATK